MASSNLRETSCPRCKGSGQLSNGKPCKKCKGKGVVPESSADSTDIVDDSKEFEIIYEDDTDH